jgi:hypothetical protein
VTIAKGGSASPKTMAIETLKAQTPKRQNRISFANALRSRRGERSTVDVSLVNEELARFFEDLVESIFKKRVRSEERRTAMSCRD